MKELPGPKVLRIAPTVVSLTMSTAEKPISYCSLRGYLALTSCLPMEKRSMTETAWRQGGDVTPPLKQWTLTVYISRPICNLTKPATEPWQYIQGCINNNNDHVIKGNRSVSLSFLHDTSSSRAVFFDKMSGCLFLAQCGWYAPLPHQRAPVPGCCYCLARPVGASSPWCGWTGAPLRWSTNTLVRGHCCGNNGDRGRKGSTKPHGTLVKRYTTWAWDMTCFSWPSASSKD